MLYIYNVSDQSNPIKLSEFEIDQYVPCFNSCFENELLILQSNEIKIINVTNPYDPFLASTIDPDNYQCNDICIQNRTLFISSRYVHIYNLENPLVPIKIATMDNYYSFNDIFVSNELLYGIYQFGISVYNITFLSDTKQISFIGYDVSDKIQFAKKPFSPDDHLFIATE